MKCRNIKEEICHSGKIKKMNKTKMKAKILFAHSMQVYNTPQEESELVFIKATYPTASITCPNHDIGELSDYKDYLKIVDACTMVVASEVDGYVGKGVLCEVARGFSNGMQVRLIREKAGNFVLCDVIGFKMENGADR